MIIGYTSQEHYEKSPAKRQCEEHYKTIVKTVHETQTVKKCEDMPKKVCEHIKKEVYFLLFNTACEATFYLGKSREGELEHTAF